MNLVRRDGHFLTGLLRCAGHCLLLNTIFLSGLVAAESSSIEEWVKYEKEIENFSRSLTLTPLVLSKARLVPGDVATVHSSLVTRSNRDLVPPSRPAPMGQDTTLDRAVRSSDERDVCMQSWSLRRRGDKQSVSVRFSKISLPVLRPGEKIDLSLTIAVDALNLASGEWELTLQCIAPTGGKVLFERAIFFTVDNPRSVDKDLAAGKRKKQEDELVAAVSRRLASALRLGELSLSVDSVKKGSYVEVGCKLSNTGKEDVVIAMPPDLSDVHFFYEQWFLTKVPAANARRDPYGFTMLRTPRENRFDAGASMDIRQKVDTGSLEPGTYEIVLEVRTKPGTLIGMSKKRFKVTR